PVAREPVERRVDRPLRKAEDVIRAGAEPADDPVAVRRLRLERREDERVEMPFENLGPHLASLYIATRGMSRERLSRLEQRLQPGEHEHPPRPRDALRRLRRAFELVVDERQQAGAVVARLDLPRDAARLLRRHLRIPLRPPTVDEAARRVVLEDRVVA